MGRNVNAVRFIQRRCRRCQLPLTRRRRRRRRIGNAALAIARPTKPSNSPDAASRYRILMEGRLFSVFTESERIIYRGIIYSTTASWIFMLRRNRICRRQWRDILDDWMHVDCEGFPYPLKKWHVSPQIFIGEEFRYFIQKGALLPDKIAADWELHWICRTCGVILEDFKENLFS